MNKARFDPMGCPIVQTRLAMSSALDLIHAEMMGWPEGERPTRIHSLESLGLGIRVHYATGTSEHAERSLDAYTPVVWHELALVKDRQSDFLHHRPLVRQLNALLACAASAT